MILIAKTLQKNYYTVTVINASRTLMCLYWDMTVSIVNSVAAEA